METLGKLTFSINIVQNCAKRKNSTQIHDIRLEQAENENTACETWIQVCEIWSLVIIRPTMTLIDSRPRPAKSGNVSSLPSGTSFPWLMSRMVPLWTSLAWSWTVTRYVLLLASTTFFLSLLMARLRRLHSSSSTTSDSSRSRSCTFLISIGILLNSSLFYSKTTFDRTMPTTRGVRRQPKHRI